MRKLKNIIAIFSITLALGTACTEPYDVELGNDFTRLIVFGEISTDTATQSIRLTRSADYFSNKPAEPVSGAIVKISDGFSEIVLSENLLNPGNYETPSDFSGTPGKTYSLSISNVDINNDGNSEYYDASSTLPVLANLDSIGIKYASYPFFKGNEILLYAQDPAETNDFYSFKLRKNGVLQTDSLSELIVQSDMLFNGSYTNGISVQYLDDAKESERVFAGDTIVFEMYGISQAYYIFILEAQTEFRGSNPLFSGPPANISTNISNGALGFFAAVNVKRSKVIAPDSPYRP